MWYIPFIMALLTEFLAEDGKGIGTWGRFFVALTGVGFLSLFLAIIVGVVLPDLAVAIDTYEAILLYFIFAFLGLVVTKIARILGGIEIGK